MKKTREEVTPDGDILHDVQIIHDALNGPQFKKYLRFLNRRIEETIGSYTTPMSALRRLISSNEEYPWKMPKIFEPAPGEEAFLKVAGGLEGAFHDVSAGLHHGEYEHGIQIAFIKDMYTYRHWLGGTGLRKSFPDVWRAMFHPKHMIHLEGGDHLSLWDLVLDIQGAFLRGYRKERSGEKVKAPGVRELVGEEAYKDITGASATLLHNLFGASKGGFTQAGYPKAGSWAADYPYLAEAIINRGLKRESEDKEEKKSPGGLIKRHEAGTKLEWKETAREKIVKLGGKLERDWEIRPTTRVEGEEYPRRNVRM